LLLKSIVMDIIRAGWLERRTTILKNWKREWFVLRSDARLCRMSSPEKQYDKADGVLQLNRCREMRFGQKQVDCAIEPPNGSTREYLMELVPSDGDTWTLYAESMDDLVAWQIAFEDVRQLYIENLHRQRTQQTNTQIPSGRCNSVYYRRVYDDDCIREVYRSPDGTRHTVILVDRDYYDPYDDMTSGAVTGMAVASLMLIPLLFLLILI
jgi:hypothetical protein